MCQWSWYLWCVLRWGLGGYIQLQCRDNVVCLSLTDWQHYPCVEVNMFTSQWCVLRWGLGGYIQLQCMDNVVYLSLTDWQHYPCDEVNMFTSQWKCANGADNSDVYWGGDLGGTYSFSAWIMVSICPWLTDSIIAVLRSICSPASENVPMELISLMCIEGGCLHTASVQDNVVCQSNMW